MGGGNSFLISGFSRGEGLDVGLFLALLCNMGGITVSILLRTRAAVSDATSL